MPRKLIRKFCKRCGKETIWYHVGTGRVLTFLCNGCKTETWNIAKEVKRRR